MTSDLFERYAAVDPANTPDVHPDWGRVLTDIDARARMPERRGYLIPVGPATTKQRGLLVAATAFAVVVILGLVLTLFSRTGEVEPAGPTPTTVATVTPVTPDSLRLEPGIEVASQLIDQAHSLAVGDGALWVATEAGIVRWDLATTTSVLFQLGSDIPATEGQSVGEIIVAPDGSVWASGWNQYLVRFDGTAWSEPEGFAELDVVSPPCSVDEKCDNALTAMAVGPDGKLYLGMGAKTLVIRDGRNWTTVTVPPEAAGVEGNSWWAWDMDVAPDGTLWVAAMDGVAAYRDGTWKWYTAADGVPPDVTSVTVAPNGDVWVLLGWPPSGVVGRFDGTTWTVQNIGQGLSDAEVTAIAAGPNGVIWAIESSDTSGATPEERAAGRITEFDGTSWTSIAVEDVGAGFGSGGAVVDDTGTLWIGANWGVVGYDGNRATVLRVGSEARPAVEAPHIDVEGGTDILATTIAKPTPPVATCPPGSQPDLPGPADQDRPAGSGGSMAFDRLSGQIVAHLEGPTWTYDVCSNTWTQLNDSGFSDSDSLVYDADSDLLLDIDFGRPVLVYDANSDTWTDMNHPPADAGSWLTAVYDPVSGLIVTRDLETAAMWAYDVDTDTWTQVDQGSIVPAPHSAASMRQTMVYDPDADRIVLYAADNHIGGDLWESSGIHATWTFDLRAGAWTVEPTATPDLGWMGPAVYDEAAHLSVFFADAGVAAYDAAARQWQIIAQAGPDGAESPSPIYDPVNQRVLAVDGDPTAVWAFDTATGRWIELLPPTD